MGLIFQLGENLKLYIFCLINYWLEFVTKLWFWWTVKVKRILTLNSEANAIWIGLIYYNFHFGDELKNQCFSSDESTPNKCKSKKLNHLDFVQSTKLIMSSEWEWFISTSAWQDSSIFLAMWIFSMHFVWNIESY